MMTGAPPRIPVGCGAFVSFHPSLGSVVSHQIGAPDGIPAYFSIPSMSRSGGPNFLGPDTRPLSSPMIPNRSSFRVRDVTIPSGLTDGRVSNHARRFAVRSTRCCGLLSAAAGDPVMAADEFFAARPAADQQPRGTSRL